MSDTDDNRPLEGGSPGSNPRGSVDKNRSIDHHKQNIEKNMNRSDDRPPRSDETVVHVEPPNIPERFKRRDKWLLWDNSADTPRRPHWRGDFGISWNDSDDWHTFEQALEASQERDSWGIGYVFTPDDDEYMIDVDGGFNDEGKPREWFPGLDRFTDDGAYMEWSPSGDGVHIPVEGQLPEWWSDSELEDKEHQGVDVLTNKFCTFTGAKHPDSGDNVTEVNAAPFLFNCYQNLEGEPPQPEADESESGQNYDGDEWLTDDDVEAALDEIDPDLPHNEWIKLAYAVHDYDRGSNGKSLFESWSKRGQKWDADAKRSVDSIWNNATEGSDVTVATLIHKAKESGWAPPTEDKDTTVEMGNAGENSTSGAHALSPETVATYAGIETDDLGDLPAAKKAYYTWQAIESSDEHHILSRLPDETLFAYDQDTKIWNDNGEQVVRAAGRRILQDEYSKTVGNELVEQVRTAPGAQRQQDEFGVPEGHIAVDNGLLDMDSRELRPLKPGDYAIRRLPVAFDPDADAQRWREFVHEVVEDGKEQVVQEYVGYTLMVDQLPHHRALMLVGGGANGKSTFLNVVRRLLGRENLCATSLQKLSNDEHARADLYGTIANIDADLSAKALGDGEMFKKLLGDDRVQARELYQDGFEFDARQKHLYAANKVPNTNVDDDAFFRRWLIVEFPNYFPPNERDPNLLDMLTTDESLSGVLNWALKGRDRLLEQVGFSHDPLAGEVRERWQSWGDAVTEFVNEFVEPDTDGRFSTTEAYDRFTAWHNENKDGSPASQKRVTSEIKKVKGANYKEGVRIEGKVTRGFTGISFTDDAPEPAGASRDGSQKRF